MQVRRDPATTGRIPSNTWRPARSWLNPRYTRSRSTRPLCEMPKPCLPDTRAPLRRQRIVRRVVAQERDDVADRGKADAHDDRIAGAVNELVDRAAIEVRCGGTCDLDMPVVDEAPCKTGRRDPGVGLALPHRQRRPVRVGNRIDERAD